MRSESRSICRWLDKDIVWVMTRDGLATIARRECGENGLKGSGYQSRGFVVKNRGMERRV